MQRTRLLSNQTALGTTSGVASSISSATCVRLYNGSGSAATVSLTSSVGAADTSTFTMPDSTVEFLEKLPTDVIWASSASVLASKVGFTN